MEIAKRYNPQGIEEKWYTHWEDKDYFHSEPDEREPFTIIIPPPNVTGILHMGHMLNNTIQDVLIRKARMEGKNACWVPGTDHASIATEAKVVRWLREEKGITKGELSRDKFMEYAWEWKEKYGGIILQQLRKLGASCDWKRTAFTMDEIRSEMVIQAFIDLYNRGKLYRDYRMVNWDPQAKTVLSNEEVIYGEENGHLYHVRYEVVNSPGEYLIIATTRPETILADTALAVHPEDERYTHLKGKEVYVPLIKRAIPIIQDAYVDREFGTGALKITPAHDPNDYEIGINHKLEVIDMFTPDGKLNEKAQLFVGQDRFEARKSINKALKESGDLLQIEDYRHNVGRSERTNAIIEPRLSLQWYVEMKALADPALKSVVDDDIQFFPENQKNLYRHWMENIRDWCISRQLWWGHRIPAYYMEDDVFVAKTTEEALQQAKEKYPDRQIEASDLNQDEDVLDTWFSSWLWPISVFDGFKNKEEIDYYYPTTVLVTGWDIIFLWVARMIMAGYEWKNEKPYHAVYFTGMVRDKQRRKMSKSLGNSPDALELIEKFGADGVRFGMLSCSPAGGDLLFDEKLCEQGKNFCNKIWNAMRLIKGWKVSSDIQQSDKNTLAVKWIRERVHEESINLHQLFDQYKLADGLMKLYSLIWDDFCSWYLEMIKPAQNEVIDAETYEVTIRNFEHLMALLHPYMPFVTEEIWHILRERNEGDDCMISKYPEGVIEDTSILKKFAYVKKLIATMRDLRNKNQLRQRDPLKLSVQKSNAVDQLLATPGMADLLTGFGFLEDISVIEGEAEGARAFVIGTDKYFLHTGDQGDTASQIERIQKELDYAKGFVVSVERKLQNERFVKGAPETVVAKERQKLADGQARIKILEESLASLSGK
jgi:valyl-tRNA synthetase